MLGQLHLRDGAQTECVICRTVAFWLCLLMVALKESGAYFSENNSWTSNGKSAGWLALFPLFYHHSAFTAWISPAIKAHGSSPVHTTSFPRERTGRDALPCPRLRQFLSSVPSWQSRRPSQRFQLGMHLCSCWHSNSNLLQRPGSAGEVAVTLGPAQSSR